VYLLKATLILKILLTIGWSASLLFLSRTQFEKLGVPEPKPVLFTRLLGAAFLALLVGYALGLRDLCRGEMPVNTMLVGIVSNGLACVILVYFGFQGTWGKWGALRGYCMWGSTILTGLITALLGISFLMIRGEVSTRSGSDGVRTPDPVASTPHAGCRRGPRCPLPVLTSAQTEPR